MRFFRDDRHILAQRTVLTSGKDMSATSCESFCAIPHPLHPHPNSDQPLCDSAEQDEIPMAKHERYDDIEGKAQTERTVLPFISRFSLRPRVRLPFICTVLRKLSLRKLGMRKMLVLTTNHSRHAEMIFLSVCIFSTAGFYTYDTYTQQRMTQARMMINIVDILSSGPRDVRTCSL